MTCMVRLWALRTLWALATTVRFRKGFLLVGETLADVRTTIRDLLDDPRKDFFSDAVVNRAITRANQIVYNLLVKRDPSIFST